MTVYEFVLRFAVGGADTDPAQFFEALAEAGCTDALVGVGRMGVIGLDFARASQSAEEALGSAIASVKRAIPGSVLIEASPDLVGLTELAEILGFSRQYMRTLASTHHTTFPAPVHQGRPSLWHLATVLEWVESVACRAVDPMMAEVARVTMSLNAAVGERSADDDAIIRSRALIA